jgi:formylmethanofuran dehydrogenase subunit E
MTVQQTPLDIESARRFHGHSCPGLAIGIRVAEIALRRIGPHSSDEEVVCIAETDNCALDAIQYFTGCTAGKGNLLHRDYGKNVFTFIRRSDGKAIRIAVRAGRSRRSESAEPEPVQQSREARIDAIMAAPLQDLFEVREVEVDMPARARILDSVICSECGEGTMSTRVRYFRGQPYCIPCFDGLTQGQANLG